MIMTTTPKGWKLKDRDDESAIYLSSDEKKVVVWGNKGKGIIDVDKSGVFYTTKDLKWYVLVAENSVNGDVIVDKEFKTKSEAQAFAIRWMRQHPNG